MTDTSNVDQALTGGHMTIWEHIGELRSRLIKCILAIVLGMALGFVIYPYLLEFLLIPFRNLNAETAQTAGKLFATDPLDPFATRIKVSAYTGIVIAMPVWLWQVWRFVTPGLYPKEKRYAIPFVLSAIVLFCMGAAIAYFSLNPALQFLIHIGGMDIQPIYTPDAYVTLILYMMLAFGLGFQFPVLLVALQIAGVLTPRRLMSWWRMATVIIAVVAAVITPSGDPISMLALGIPMYLLYWLSIAVGAVILRRRTRRAAKAARQERKAAAAAASSDD
jgi:sec-independent protein translocase protein TatC